MSSFYGNSVTLFTAVLLMSNCAFSNNFSSGSTLINGQSFSTGTGGVVSNGASISVQNNNGNIEVYLDGQKIDLSAATVISDDGNTKVYQPAEQPEARIAIDRENEVTVDFKGAHYETASPRKIQEQIENQMREMNNRFRSMFQPFPFGF